jgi:hypothetical protein
MNHPMIGQNCRSSSSAPETRGVVLADRHEHDPTRRKT